MRYQFVFVLKGEKGDVAYFIGGTPEETVGSFWECCCYDPRQDKWEEINAPDEAFYQFVGLPQGNQALVWNEGDVWWKFIP